MTTNKKNLIIDLLESPCGEVVSESRLSNAEKHINLLHRDYDGNMTLCMAQEGNEDYLEWSQYSFKSTDLESIIYKFIFSNKDLYMTINGFWNYTRRVEDLRHLKAFVIDLDYYKVDLYSEVTPPNMWKFIKNKEKYFFKKIGKPSFIVNSGRGLYLTWLIESAHPNALSIWSLCMGALFNKFEKYGADPNALDASRVFRVCGSENTKNNEVVNFIDLNKEVKVYTLEHFRSTLLPNNFEKYIPKQERDEYNRKKAEEKAKERAQKKAEEKKKKRSGKKEIEAAQTANLFTIYQLHFTRIKDLNSLVQIRGYDIHKYSCREKLLFYYRYWSCCFTKEPKKALEDVLSLNSKFTRPLDKKEVIEATKSAEKYFKKWEKTFDELCEEEKKEGRRFSQKEMNKFFTSRKCRIFTNKKIIEDLKISQEEMQVLQTLISKKEKNYRYKDDRNEKNKIAMKKKRRNEFGRTQREQQKYEKMVVIAQMLDEGFKYKDIAERLKCSISTVSKYAGDLREGKYILEEVDDSIFEIDKLEQMA